MWDNYVQRFKEKCMDSGLGRCAEVDRCRNNTTVESDHACYVRIYNLGQIVGTGVTKYLGTVSQSGREKEIAVQTCQKCYENNKRLPPTTDRVE